MRNLLLVVCCLLLASCATPPEPQSLLTIGQATTDWYADPSGKLFVEPEVVELAQDELKSVEVQVRDQDFIYKTGYVWDGDEWNVITFDSDTKINDQWLADDASASIAIDLAFYEPDTYFVAAYSCNLVNRAFDCNGGKWMLKEFVVEAKEILPPPACPLIYDPVCGVDGVTYGNACQADVAGVAIDYEGDCETDTPSQRITDFVEKPTEYVIGSSKDLVIEIGDDHPNIDSVIFQVWHFDDEQVQADLYDNSAPFVYPGAFLDTVNIGSGSVEAFLQKEGQTIKTLRFNTNFVPEKIVTDFIEKPKKYAIGSSKDLIVKIGDDYPNIDSAVFQVWHFDDEQVQADLYDYSPPFVYPGTFLNKVNAGNGSVEVFLKEKDVTVKTIRFNVEFTMESEELTFACNDGVDNDGDSKIDLDDPGCLSKTDNSEYNVVTDTTCTSDCTANSITQYGITWTFDKEYEYGKFANGDYWIKGPVTLTGIIVNAQSGNPTTPTNGRNGFQITPGIQHHQGYDNRAYDYSASLQPSFPVYIEGGNNIVSAISAKEGIETGVNLHLVAILTVVDQVPPGRGSEVFRPPYTNPSAPYRYASELQLDVVPSVAPVSGSPDLNVVTFHQSLPQFQNKFGWRGGSLRPRYNLKAYPVDAVKEDGAAMLLLTLNSLTLEQKMPLLIARVQTGIDLYEMVKQGRGWPADGGHSSGRLIAITMAGLLLDDQDMLTVSKQTDFAEIQQTFYSTKNPPRPEDFPSGNTNPNPGCYQKLSEKYVVDVPGLGMAYARYGIRHLQFPYKASMNGEYALCSDTEGYSTYWRLNAPSWSGQACAARLFGLEDTIDHPAFFDHMDRFMDNDIDNMNDWQRVPFSDAMWYKHCDPWR